VNQRPSSYPFLGGSLDGQVRPVAPAVARLEWHVPATVLPRCTVEYYRKCLRRGEPVFVEDHAVAGLGDAVPYPGSGGVR